MVLGNGEVVGVDRAETLNCKADWSSSSLESADKKESSEISGNREHTPSSRSQNSLYLLPVMEIIHK